MDIQVICPRIRKFFMAIIRRAKNIDGQKPKVSITIVRSKKKFIYVKNI